MKFIYVSILCVVFFIDALMHCFSGQHCLNQNEADVTSPKAHKPVLVEPLKYTSLKNTKGFAERVDYLVPDISDKQSNALEKHVEKQLKEQKIEAN